MTLSVTLEGPDLRASRQVYEGYANGFTNLARYFEDLTANWRGWSGSRSYESIEGDLRLDATHDGHVNLRVLLWESTVPGGWRVEGELRLDAGEPSALLQPTSPTLCVLGSPREGIYRDASGLFESPV